MKGRVFSLALAAVAGLIALSLLSGVAAGDSGGSNGAPKSLTNRFPLGSQTLSRTKTAPARGSATTPSRGSATPPHRTTATTPHRATATTPHRRATAPAAHQQTHGGIPSLVLLALIPVMIAVALLGAAVVWRSRRTEPRDRRPPSLPVGRPPARITRSADNGARWAYVDKHEVESKPPSLPVRRRAD